MITWAVLAVAVAFYLGLMLKKYLPILGCALCVAVAATWFVLWLISQNGVVVNPLLLALMIGESVVGTYYLAEKRASQDWQIFRLPFFLSLMLVGLMLASATPTVGAALIVAGLWAIHALLFYYRKSPRLQTKVRAIIDCCSGW